MPLIEAAGLDPNSVKVVLLNDPEINAFVATGQTVYVQSGLLEAADNVNQLQGVIAHELGHVDGRRFDPQRRGRQAGDRDQHPARWCSARAAIAAGAGDAGMGIMMAGQQAADGRVSGLHPRPGSDRRRDRRASFSPRPGSAARACSTSSTSCRTRNIASAIYSKDSFDRDHPLSSERIQALQQKLQDAIRPGTSRPIRRSRRGSSGSRPSCSAIVDPKQAVIKYPESDQSIPAHYARAYAYHLGGYPDKANAEADALLAKDPHDPFFLELKGQILLEDGKPQEAIRAASRSDRAVRQRAADRGDARPRAGRDRGPEEFRRGQADPEGRGEPRQ